MRIVVVGGKGLVGSRTVQAIRERGHEAVVASRAVGVDVESGEGLDAVLEGADTTVDVLNTPALHRDGVEAFFSATTKRLLEAGPRAGVAHHVLLSIVGVDRLRENPHYAGKQIQERLVAEGPMPHTILRATQFFDFAGMVADWTRDGDTVTVPPLLVQPVAVDDVAEALAEAATGPPQTWAADIAGPEPQDLVDMARRTLVARGEAETRIVPSWRGGPFSVEMAGEILLPDESARLAPTTFDAWLAGQRES